MTEAATGLMALRGGDAEGWSWERRIAGICRCPIDSGAISLIVDGAEHTVTREGHRFSAAVLLGEGKHRVVARCRCRERECSSDPVILWQRLERRPAARVSVSVSDQVVCLDGGLSGPGEGDGAPIAEYVWHLDERNPAPLAEKQAGSSGNGSRLTLEAPARDGEYRASLRVTDAAGRSDEAKAYFTVQHGKPRAMDIDSENPDWVASAVVYGLVPHNLGPHGFRSVVERLDHLASLGIDVIWLSPCTATADPGHGYGVNDYFELRSDYGTKEDFRDLIAEAHGRGIRVLMDFVPNHTAADHRYMRDRQRGGRESAYYDFYEHGEGGKDYSYYFDWAWLPNLNYDHPEVRRWMMEAFSYWVREFDVDGFRPKWQRELKRIKPHLLLLDEASARDPYWFTHGFDAAYDWTDEVGRWAWEHVFDDPMQIPARLRAALTNEGRGFHDDALVFRFLNNNDTGKRFITRHGLDMERVAAALLLTLPGLPCIYMGQECGAEFEPYRTPGPIEWEDRHGLCDYYQRLIFLRKRMASLHSRCWELLDVDSEHPVFAYARYGESGDPPVLVVLNFSEQKTEVQLRLTERSAQFASSSFLVDLLGGKPVRAESTGQSSLGLVLDGLSAGVLAGS